jgi:RHS repeat-associated protein
MITKTSGTASWAYKYDYQNRLKSATLNGLTVLQASYDEDGRRIQTIAVDTTVYDYVAGSWDPAFVKDLTTNAATDFIFAASLRVGKVQGAATSYYHLDRLGSVRLVTQAANVVAFQTEYQPYGALSATTGSETFQFTGKQLDSTTGLYYFGNRYYDSQSGRFVSEDPAPANSNEPQSLNRYVYALDNPLVNIDPTGLYDPGYETQAEAEKLESIMDLEDYGHFSAGQAEAATKAGMTYDKLVEMEEETGRSFTASEVMAALSTATSRSSTTATGAGMMPGFVRAAATYGLDMIPSISPPTNPANFSGTTTCSGTGALLKQIIGWSSSNRYVNDFLLMIMGAWTYLSGRYQAIQSSNAEENGGAEPDGWMYSKLPSRSNPFGEGTTGSDFETNEGMAMFSAGWHDLWSGGICS